MVSEFHAAFGTYLFKYIAPSQSHSELSGCHFTHIPFTVCKMYMRKRSFRRCGPQHRLPGISSASERNYVCKASDKKSGGKAISPLKHGIIVIYSPWFLTLFEKETNGFDNEMSYTLNTYTRCLSTASAHIDPNISGLQLHQIEAFRPVYHVLVKSCNCSICANNGYLLVYSERQQIECIKGEDALVDYTFATGNKFDIETLKLQKKDGKSFVPK